MFKVICRVSATNCAQTYERSKNRRRQTEFCGGEWQFGTTLTMENVWDAFVLFCLLEDCFKIGTTLSVPHTGKQKDRFTKAMEDRNEWTIWDPWAGTFVLRSRHIQAPKGIPCAFWHHKRDPTWKHMSKNVSKNVRNHVSTTQAGPASDCTALRWLSPSLLAQWEIRTRNPICVRVSSK